MHCISTDHQQRMMLIDGKRSDYKARLTVELTNRRQCKWLTPLAHQCAMALTRYTIYSKCIHSL